MFRTRTPCHPIFVQEEYLLPPPRRKLRWRFALVLGMVIAAVLTWQSARADAMTTEQVEAGQLLLKSTATGVMTAALSQDSKVHIRVSGMVAHVSVQQQFRNDSQQWVEGVYAFPLPDKAAVNRMRIVVGERVIEGKIREKEEAKKIYQAAKAEGKRAGLVKQQRPNLFTTQVANIGPYETVSVQLEYVETVAYDHGRFSLRFPMTITPRYIPGAPLSPAAEENLSLQGTADVVTTAFGWAINTDQVPDASDITPWLNPKRPLAGELINPVEITAELDMGMSLQAIDSAYHSIVSSRDNHRYNNHRYNVRLSQGRVSMAQDFVLSWQPRVGAAPQAAFFSETVPQEKIPGETGTGEHYGLLMVVPPQQTVAAHPKEMIYIIDTSGSMDGVSIQQARRSLLYALEQLLPADRFNVIAFNSTTHELFATAVAATAENLATARNYVQRLQSGGGTEMLPALQAALRNAAPETHVRQVMFITDGAVGNEQALFNTIYQQLGSSRLFTVGIGSAPNTHFMRKAAQFGRGTFTHIGDVAEVEEKIQALIEKLHAPVVTDIVVEWPDHRRVESYPERIPDLYRGEPLLVAVKLRDLQGDIVVSGQLADEGWNQRIRIDGPGQHTGVATLWAREKIASLLDRNITGGDAQEIREAVLDVALSHQLVSPYTSFIAVEEAPVRPSHEAVSTQAVLNTRPQGQGDQAFAYPRTATGALAGLCWGMLLLTMFLVLRFVMQREERYGLV